VSQQVRQDLLADLARLLGRYSATELRDGLDALTNPETIAALRDLIDKSAHARSSQPRPPRKPTEKPESGGNVIDRVERLKLSRPGDSELIDEILRTATNKWTRARVERVAEITARQRIPRITARDSKRRLTQLVTFVERASRSELEELAAEFRAETSSSGTLAAWSDIILGEKSNR
jgi:translation initiation factor 1 (eIF-1/SUI1)